MQENRRRNAFAPQKINPLKVAKQRMLRVCKAFRNVPTHTAPYVLVKSTYIFGDGPLSPVNVASFAQFLRSKASYGEATERFAATSATFELVPMLLGAEGWLSVDAGHAILQLFAQLRTTLGELGNRVVDFLWNSIREQSLNNVVSTVLLTMEFVTEDRAREAIARLESLSFETLTDLASVSKGIKAIRSLSVKFPTLVDEASVIAGRYFTKCLEITSGIKGDDTFTLGETLSVLVADVALCDHLVRGGQREIVFKDLLRLVIPKAHQLKSHNVCNVMKGVAMMFKCLDLQVVLSLVSRLADRLGSLQYVVSFSELYAFLESATSVVVWVRSRVESDGALKEDLIDLEIELTSMTSRIVKGMACGLGKNLVTSPDDVRVPSRQHHVQRLIPPREDIVGMLRVLDVLGVGTLPDELLWLHGSAIDHRYKCEAVGESNRSLAATASGRAVVVEEFRRVIPMDLCWPPRESLPINEAGELEAAYPLMMTVEWAPFATKYKRLNVRDHPDFFEAIKQQTMAFCNVLEDRKGRYFALAALLGKLLSDPSHSTELRIALGHQRKLSKRFEELVSISFFDDHKQPLTFDPKRAVDALLHIVFNTGCSLTAVPSTSTKSPPSVLASTKRILKLSREAALSALRRFPTTCTMFEVTPTADLLLFIVGLCRTNLLTDIPNVIQRDLIEQIKIRLPTMEVEDFMWIVNALYPQPLAAKMRNVRRVHGAFTAMDVYSAVRSEAIRRLNRAAASTNVALRTEVQILRCLGVSIGGSGCEGDADLALTMIKKVLSTMRRQCTTSEMLVKVAFELEALFLRFDNDALVCERRENFHTLVLTLATSLAKSKMLRAPDAFRLIRCFPLNASSKARETLLADANSGAAPAEMATYNLHTELLKIISIADLTFDDFVPLSIALDALTSLHRSQWRQFFIACRDVFLKTVRTSSREHKRHWCKALTKVFSEYTSRRNRMPWALCEYLHHFTVDVRDIISTLEKASDRSFGSFTLLKLKKQLPLSPFHELLILRQIPMTDSGMRGRVHHFLAVRLFETFSGLFVQRHLEGSEVQAVIMTAKRAAARYIAPGAALTDGDDVRGWARRLQEAAPFIAMTAEKMAGLMSYEVLAGIIELVASDYYTMSCAEELFTATRAAEDYLARGLDKISASDLELTAYFNSDAANSCASPHSSVVLRMSTERNSPAGFIAVMLMTSREVSTISTPVDDATATCAGYLQLCRAAEGHEVVYTEKCSSMPIADGTLDSKGLRAALRRGQDAAIEWSNAHRPQVSQRDTSIVCKRSWDAPARTFEAQKTASILGEFGSLAKCPDVLPVFRAAAIAELKRFSRLMKSGKVATFDISVLAASCDAFGTTQSLSRCLKAWAACNKEAKEKISIRGLGTIFELSAKQGGRFSDLQQVCLNHLLYLSDAAFARSIVTTEDLAMFFIHSQDFLLANIPLQRRVLNRLEETLPLSGFVGLRSILGAYIALPQCIFKDDLRMILSRMPLFVCNDVSQFEGESLIILCNMMNEGKLLAAETLDAIVDNVSSTDELNEDRWVPSTFQGELTYGAKVAFARERERVHEALKNIVVKSDPANADDMFDTIE